MAPAHYPPTQAREYALVAYNYIVPFSLTNVCTGTCIYSFHYRKMLPLHTYISGWLSDLDNYDQHMERIHSDDLARDFVVTHPLPPYG